MNDNKFRFIRNTTKTEDKFSKFLKDKFYNYIEKKGINMQESQSVLFDLCMAEFCLRPSICLENKLEVIEEFYNSLKVIAVKYNEVV